jgi:transcriptional regulator with XRE-family HTH domain
MKPPSKISEQDWYIETGRRIKDARREVGLTQEELALASGLQRSSITHIERGTQKTSVYSLYLISIALEKSFSDLLPNTGKANEIEFAGKKDTVPPAAKSILDKFLAD